MSIGLSLNEETQEISRVEASIESMRFASDISNPILENAVVDEERGHGDLDIKLGYHSDIQRDEL